MIAEGVEVIDAEMPAVITIFLILVTGQEIPAAVPALVSPVRLQAVELPTLQPSTMTRSEAKQPRGPFQSGSRGLMSSGLIHSVFFGSWFSSSASHWANRWLMISAIS